MTEVTTSTTAAATQAPAATAVTRGPKLVARVEGKELPLLKYPFPTKAAKYPVKVNGAVVDAATTAGKGKAYTYLLINNTSFYVPGMLPVDAEIAIDFPDGYKFDDTVAPRVSIYKPKKDKKAKKAAEAAAEGAAPEAKAEGAAPEAKAEAAAAAPAPEAKAKVEQQAEQPNGTKAARRGK